MSHTISCTTLKPGTFVNVRGKVEFSRLTRLIEGDELLKMQQNRAYTPDKPFTTITLSDATIVPQDPNNMSREELYVQESFYTSSSKPGQHYSINNKSPNFPRFYQVKVNPDGSIDNTKVSEVPAKAELAKGLDVILVLRVFKPKNFQNCGIGLDSVIAQEQIRYYNGGNAINHLAAMGITVENELSDTERTTAAQQATTAPAPAAEPTQADNFNNAQPVQAPVGNPYMASPQPAAQPASAMPAPTSTTTPAPATPTENSDNWVCPSCGTTTSGKFCNNCGTKQPEATPAPTPATTVTNDNWTCPNCGTANTGKFCNNCGTKQPEAAPTPIGGSNPYASNEVLGQTQTGIRFDPNDNNRNY